MQDIQWCLLIMNSPDKMKLLAGLPIPMSDFSCSLYPSTLREIATIGTSKYFKYINLLTIKKEEILTIVKEEIDPFDFLIINASSQEEFKDELIEALKFFVKEEILFLPEIECFVVGDFQNSRMITKDNFNEFQKILSIQNFLEEDVVKFAGENASATYIKNKLEKGRKKIEQIKNKKLLEQIELADLVGSLSINSNLNICTVWDISYYAFNDQFKRMRLLEKYNTDLRSIMAGADPKKIKIQDWIQSIQ